MAQQSSQNTAIAAPTRQDSSAGPRAIELQGVHKHFGHVHAVKGVDLTVASGEIVAFLGPNGAGKTSTIDITLGLSRPDAGEAAVYGMAPRRAIADTAGGATRLPPARALPQAQSMRTPRDAPAPARRP